MAIYGGERLTYWTGRLLRGIDPGTQRIGVWMGPRIGQHVLEKRTTLWPPSPGIQTPDHPARRVVAIPTTLTRLSFHLCDEFTTQVAQITCVLNPSVYRRLDVGNRRDDPPLPLLLQLKTGSTVSIWQIVTEMDRFAPILRTKQSKEQPMKTLPGPPDEGKTT
jgi:hypothetical protein